MRFEGKGREPSRPDVRAEVSALAEELDALPPPHPAGPWREWKDDDWAQYQAHMLGIVRLAFRDDPNWFTNAVREHKHKEREGYPSDPEQEARYEAWGAWRARIEACRP